MRRTHIGGSARDKKEFHDGIVDLVKRKQLTIEAEPEKLVEVRATLLNEVAVEDGFTESHYMKPHWVRATTDTPVRIGDVKESVLALIDHGLEINLISMDFFKIEYSREYSRFF